MVVCHVSLELIHSTTDPNNHIFLLEVAIGSLGAKQIQIVPNVGNRNSNIVLDDEFIHSLFESVAISWVEIKRSSAEHLIALALNFFLSDTLWFFDFQFLKSFFLLGNKSLKLFNSLSKSLFFLIASSFHIEASLIMPLSTLLSSSLKFIKGSLEYGNLILMIIEEMDIVLPNLISVVLDVTSLLAESINLLLEHVALVVER